LAISNRSRRESPLSDEQSSAYADFTQVSPDSSAIWILATIHSVSHPSIHLGIPVRYLFLAELKREIGLRLLPSAGSGSGSRPSKTHFKALRER